MRPPNLPFPPPPGPKEPTEQTQTVAAETQVVGVAPWKGFQNNFRAMEIFI